MPTTFTAETTIEQAIEILKKQAEEMANSAEVQKFKNDNPHWSNLFRETHPAYHEAMLEYEAAVELYEWLNGKKKANANISIKQAFIELSERDRLSLFHQRVNSTIPTLFDEYLKIWWMNRY